MSAVAAVIFDVDGLMADTEPIHRAVWHELGKRLGFPTYASDAHDSLGERVIDTFKRRRAEGRLAHDPHVLLDAYHALLIEHLRSDLQPKPGLFDLLDFVQAHGWGCGAASSGDRVYIWEVLAILGVRERFQAVATGDEVPQGKPDPALYLLAARRLSVPPAACVALEDSPRGVQAARAAGMRCIAVPEDEHDFSLATAVCPSLLAVREVLSAWAAAP